MLSDVMPPASVPVGSRKRTRVWLAFEKIAAAGIVALKNWPPAFVSVSPDALPRESERADQCRDPRGERQARPSLGERIVGARDRAGT